LTPAQVRDILRKSARDVTAGNCSAATGGNAAVPGPDTATGNGLVDAHKAVLTAKVRCLSPARGLVRGREPIRSREPIRRRKPIGERGPFGHADFEETFPETAEGTGQLSPEDIQTLEDMIISSDIDDI
jgi:hypothetical protein